MFDTEIANNNKVRHYCVTFWKKPVLDMRYTDKVRYSIFGEEICPRTSKKHWQGYIELTTPQRGSYIAKIYNDKQIKFFVRAGTRDQARDYCKKDNKYEETGTWIVGQGHRSDLESVVEELKTGKKLSNLMLDNPKVYCQYRNGLKDIAAKVTADNIPIFRNVEITLLTGPSGCGKTRTAMEEATYKIQGSQLNWWQDYDGDDVICIDEYNNNLPIDELLAVLDGYKLRLNVKGSHTYAAWNKVFVTTNLTVDQLHANAKEEHRNALFRRITNVVSFWDEEVNGNTGIDLDRPDNLI